MSTKQLVSFLGKLVLLAAVVGVCLPTATSSASPIPPGFDLFTSNDALGNSLGAADPRKTSAATYDPEKHADPFFCYLSEGLMK